MYDLFKVTNGIIRSLCALYIPMKRKVGKTMLIIIKRKTSLEDVFLD